MAATVATAAMLLTGCGAGASSSSSSSGTTLVAYTGQTGGYQVNFNPYSPSQIAGQGSIYEPLFFVTNVNTKGPQPRLGTKYTWNSDGTKLSITLRSGVKWSDGKAFTAQDVVYTFTTLAKTPAINSVGFDGTASATDSTHVVLTFPHPSFTNEANVLGRVWIVPEHIWKSINPTTNVMAHPVGTGPYLAGNFKSEAFTLDANPTYWGGEPDLKHIRFLSLSGANATVDGLKGGSIDWAGGPVPNMNSVAKSYPGYGSVTVTSAQTVLEACSNTALGCAGPQVDPAVRHAIYEALDRNQINQLAWQGTSSGISPTFALTTTQKSIISSSISDPIASMKSKPSSAEKLLEADGWTKGSDGIYAKDGQRLSLTVQVVTGWSDYITALSAMTQELKKVGIELQTQQSSWNEWTDKKGKGNYQLAIDSLAQGPSGDPYYLYDNAFASVNTAPVGTVAPGINVARYSNPKVDAAIKALSVLNPTDTSSRQTQFDIIQANIVKDMPYIPVLTAGTVAIFNTKDFTGWPTASNLYASPVVYQSPDVSEIYMRLKAK
ncbi:MAG TPA: ABC transporter substrate-binding protein [Lacisediminihabitans sp.]|uniref:ABC transporter substrate-binding protein n=1 Tax=Lacisediminihabitans sp. TaxID=2787631 RepID=UPI002ED7B612